MAVSSVQSGYALINKSQSLANEAAVEIARQPENNALEFNKVDLEPKEEKSLAKINDTSDIDSMMKLNQANTYNKAGVNVVQKSNEIIGTLLDTHV